MTEPSGPPSYVPTLTQVVHVADETSSRPPAFLAQPTESDQPVTPAADREAAQALLVARVLERVEQTLETRLHEALAPLIGAYLQELLPSLKDEIELTVRDAVTQAFEHESPPNPRA